MANNFKTFIGIVVEDKQLASREIKVFLRENNPYSAGELKDNTRAETFSINNENGEKTTGTIHTTNIVVADYFGMATNRAFPPDVVKGEQVHIFQYGDEDKYYWMPGGRDDNLRKGEIVRFAACNDPNSNDDLTESNTYLMEMDTKLAQRIRLQTSTSNGEPFGLKIILDGKNGFIQINDDAGNRIEIVSADQSIKLTNKSQTTIHLSKDKINVMAPSDINIVSGGTLNVVAKSIQVNAASVSSTGAISSKGNMTNDGNITNSGTITSAGNVNAPNIP